MSTRSSSHVTAIVGSRGRAAKRRRTGGAWRGLIPGSVRHNKKCLSRSGRMWRHPRSSVRMGLARGDGGTIVTSAPAHPLDPLTAEEIRQAAAIVRRDRGVGPGWRFASIDLREPDKQLLAAGTAAGREAIVVCWDRSDGRAWRAVVSLTGDAVTAWDDLPGQQPNMTVDEWHECDQLLRAHPAMVEALARRGITDMSLVLTDMWAYGAALVPERYRGLRIGWSDVWYRDSPASNPYAHHVTGLHPVVDLNRMELLEIEDVLP